MKLLLQHDTIVLLTNLQSFAAETFFLRASFYIFTWGIWYAVSRYYCKQQLLQHTVEAILLTLRVTIGLLWVNLKTTDSIFSGRILVIPFTTWRKIIIVRVALIYFIVFANILFLKKNRTKTIPILLITYETPILIILSIFGILSLVSSSDLLTAYLRIELQSLCFYILATFRTTSKYATEAGTKYFILGAFASGLLLFGISTIYGATGSTNFETLILLNMGVLGRDEPLLQTGLFFLFIGLFFKLGLAPFHSWLPDVYEGSPLIVTFFFSLLPKLRYFSFFFCLLSGPLTNTRETWRPLFYRIILRTLRVGAFGALYQRKVKRYLAYSTITHSRYLFLALITNSEEGLQALALYLGLYVVTLVGVFSILLCRENVETNRPITYLNELVSLRSAHPLLRFGFCFLLLSMAGIPFLGGFFAKFYVFLAAWDAQLYLLVWTGILCTLVSRFYYIRVVKIILFEGENRRKTYSYRFDMGRNWALFLRSVTRTITFSLVGRQVTTRLAYWTSLL